MNKTMLKTAALAVLMIAAAYRLGAGDTITGRKKLFGLI